MSNVNNISSNNPLQGAERLDARARQVPTRPATSNPSTSEPADKVDFSAAAKRLNALQRNEGTVRPDLVERIKSKISEGGYVSDDKLAAAADALLDRLELEG